MAKSHRVVIVLPAQVQRQTNKTASKVLPSCLNFNRYHRFNHRYLCLIGCSQHLGFHFLDVICRLLSLDVVSLHVNPSDADPMPIFTVSK